MPQRPPGSPAPVRAGARGLTQVASTLRREEATLRAFVDQLTQNWQGETRKSFSTLVDEHLASMGRAAEAYEMAGQAFNDYAGRLETAQQQWDHGQRLLSQPGVVGAAESAVLHLIDPLLLEGPEAEARSAGAILLGRCHEATDVLQGVRQCFFGRIELAAEELFQSLLQVLVGGSTSVAALVGPALGAAAVAGGAVPGIAPHPQAPQVSGSGGPSPSRPAGGYTVVAGDTLSGIAARHGVSLHDLEAANPQISNPNLIHPGQHIVIPGSAPVMAPPAGGGRPAGGATARERFTTTTDLRRPSGLTAAQLDAYIDAHTKPNSKLRGLGASLVDAEQRSGVNAEYLLAHAILETGWGESWIAQNKNNLFGFNANDSNPAGDASSYPDPATCVRDCAAYISATYLTPGGAHYGGSPTLAGMNVHYATDPKWASKIAGIADGFPWAS